MRDDDKRSIIDGENQIFRFKVTFINEHHPQFCTEDKSLKLKSGNLFANLQSIVRTCFDNSKHSSFLHNVNYAKKSLNARVTSLHQRLETIFQNFICCVLIELFVMAKDQILNLNQINREPGTN